MIPQAINGAILLILGALLPATLYGLRATPRVRNTHVVTTHTGRCHTDGCDQGGVILARTIDGASIRVCHDCYTEGVALGTGWTA